ncbi:hypothetical protein NGRA_0574 [Nosema granulosis]|uniref:Uncharacterized protein n=1 Tax=Nosema granulosis TaxID=83296 RepID=A0A9P6H0P0_9MICR|nr:hypothetical protein NGRA_0574 [Nosema granulosis]
MQRESNDRLKRVLSAINTVLEENNIPNTPHNIIKYTSSTILSSPTSNIKDLLSVLFIYQDFLQEEEDLVRKLLENKMEDKAFRIMKVFLKRGRGCVGHVVILLEYYLQTNNGKGTIQQYIAEDPKVFLEGMEKLSSEDFLKIAGDFFDELLESGLEIEKVKAVVDGRDGKEVLKIMMKYTQWLSCQEISYKQNAVDENLGKKIQENEVALLTPSNLITPSNLKSEISYILGILKKINFSSLTLRIIGEILKIDRIFYCRFSKNIFEMDKDTKILIKNIISSEETSFKAIEEFFTAAKHIILPELIEITRDLCERYNSDGGEKMVPILRTIACTVGLLELSSIMNQEMDYLRWIPVLSGTCNNDISFFMQIYHRVAEKEKIYQLLPAFCNYSTDNCGKMGEFYRVVLECINNKMYYSIACNGIRNIILSQELNLSKTILLRSSIPRETSSAFLEAFCSQEIFFEILRNYNNEELPKELLFTIAKRKTVDLDATGSILFNYILSYPENPPIVLKEGIAITDIKDCLNYAKFFLYASPPSLEIPSRVLELCSSDNPQIQKKAYEFLFYLQKSEKIPLCVCEHVNSKDLLGSIKPSSTKYKLLYLSEVFNKQCLCKGDKRSSLLQSIILTGNISSKRVAEDILDNFFMHNAERDFILEFILRGLKANNLEIVSGCLSTFSYILNKYSTAIPGSTQKEVYRFICESYKTVNALVIIKSLNIFIKHTEEIVDEEINKILEFYVESRKKKYRSDIKEVVHLLIQKNLPVSRKLKRYTKFRIPTNRQTLTITKNNEIIISEEK